MFCFTCKVFGDSKVKSAFVNAGFSDWKHVNENLAEHESREAHRKAMIAFKNQAADIGTLDSHLKKQFDECEYWTEVLQRVVAVAKHLAE